MKIAMYDLQGFFLEEFEVENVYQLEQQLNHRQGGIQGVLNGKSLSSENRQFYMVTEYEEPLTKVGDVSRNGKGHSYRPVHKYYKGRYICTYYNGNQAALLNNIDESGISRCCNGKSNSSGGFTWEFANRLNVSEEV